MYSWELRRVMEGLTAPAQLTSTVPCSLEAGTRVSCSRLFSDYCEYIWAKPRRGNVDQPSGALRMGKSERSGLSQAKIMDIQALVDSEPRLPADLRAPAAPVLSRIRALMAEEQDSEDWYDRLNRAEEDFKTLIAKTSRERMYRQYPELKKVRVRDRDFDQRAIFKGAEFDLQGEVIAAKYQQHPNWLRVERLFKEAKEDLAAEIPTWDIPVEEKTLMLERLSAVRLVLPSSDPRVFSGGSTSDTCPTTQINAFYVSSKNRITVCAGLFNATQFDSDLYFTLAHELGHSNDPVRQASARFMRTATGQVMARLCNASGAQYSCAEWELLKQGPLAAPKDIPEPTPSSRRLTSCLRSEADLKPFTAEAVRGAAEEDASETMDSYAAQNAFTRLARATHEKDEGEVPYDFYLRPDRLRATHGLISARICGGNSNISLEVMTQELSCNGYSPSDPQRGRAFKRAIQVTETLEKALNQHWFAQCGRECAELARKKLGRTANEQMADWQARKVLPRFLRRLPTQASRQEAIVSAFADFCTAPSEFRKAEDLVALEKEWSTEAHPESRGRVLGMFSPEIQELAGCVADPETQKANNQCDY